MSDELVNITEPIVGLTNSINNLQPNKENLDLAAEKRKLAAAKRKFENELKTFNIEKQEFIKKTLKNDGKLQSLITKVVIVGYLIILGLTLIFMLNGILAVQDGKDILGIVGAGGAGIIGTIIGHFFGSRN